MASENIGEVVIQMRLDDSIYLNQVKAALTDADNFALELQKRMTPGRSASGRFLSREHGISRSIQADVFRQMLAEEASYSAQSKRIFQEHEHGITQTFGPRGEAMHSLRALQGTMFLLTGETGFFAVEAGRAIVHVSRLAAASGGASGAILTLAGAFRTLSASIGPLGWAALGVGAAYLAYSKFVEPLIGPQKEPKLSEATLSIYGAEQKARNALWLEQGKTTERAIARGAYEEKLGRPMNPQEEEAFVETQWMELKAKYLRQKHEEREQHEKSEAARIAKQEEAEDRLAAIRRENQRQEELEWDLAWSARRRKRRADIQEERDRRIAAEKAIAASVDEFAVRHGIRKRSEIETNPILAALAKGEEEIAALRAQPTGAFSISSMPASGWRFGFGAPGTAVGTQTGDRSAEIAEAVKATARNTDSIARALTATPTPRAGPVIPYDWGN